MNKSKLLFFSKNHKLKMKGSLQNNTFMATANSKTQEQTNLLTFSIFTRKTSLNLLV